MSLNNSTGSVGGLKDLRVEHQYFDSKLDDLPLTMEAFRVYCHLCRRAGKDESAFPSYKSIGEICFRGSYPESPIETLRKKAIAAVAELINWNILAKEERRLKSGGQTSNLYYLTNSSEWRDCPSEKSSLSKKKGVARRGKSISPVFGEDPPQSSGKTPPVFGEDPPQSSGKTPPVFGEDPKGINIKGLQIEGNPIEETPLTPHRGNAAIASNSIAKIENAADQEEEPNSPQQIVTSCTEPPESSQLTRNPELGKSSAAQLEVIPSSTKAKNSRRKVALDEQTQAWFLEAYLSNKPSNFTEHRKLSPQVGKKIQELIASHQDQAIEVFAAALTWVREQKDDWWRKTAQFSLDNLCTNGKIEQYADKHAFAMQHDSAYRDRVEGRAPSMDAARRPQATFIDNEGNQFSADSPVARAAAAWAADPFLQMMCPDFKI